MEDKTMGLELVIDCINYAKNNYQSDHIPHVMGSIISANPRYNEGLTDTDKSFLFSHSIHIAMTSSENEVINWYQKHAIECAMPATKRMVYRHFTEFYADAMAPQNKPLPKLEALALNKAKETYNYINANEDTHIIAAKDFLNNTADFSSVFAGFNEHRKKLLTLHHFIFKGAYNSVYKKEIEKDKGSHEQKFRTEFLPGYYDLITQHLSKSNFQQPTAA
jgi:hypothetical protein